MNGSGRFWQKWWFWLIAAAVVIALPFSVKYAFTEPETAGLTEPTDATVQDRTLPAPTEESTAEPEPTKETEPPTEAPTEAPAEPATEPETDPPTEAPTEEPTEPPTEPPTDPPTEPPTEPPTQPQTSGTTYVLNKNTKKFHYPDCSSVKTIAAKNRVDSAQSRDEIIAMGYSPCSRCKP